jgi:hypothetical protein
LALATASGRLRTPSRLPDILTFIGASYGPETKIAALFYQYIDPNDPNNTNGLRLSEVILLYAGNYTCPKN